jgi:hypothetical protein
MLLQPAAWAAYNKVSGTPMTEPRTAGPRRLAGLPGRALRARPGRPN